VTDADTRDAAHPDEKKDKPDGVATVFNAKPL
jgi:hypothetical protein